MERIRNGFRQMVEKSKVNQERASEEARLKRVHNHPHRLDCTRSEDIETFDEEYETSGFDGAWTGTIPTLYAYSSRCEECRCEDHSHQKNNHKKKKANMKNEIQLEMFRNILSHEDLGPLVLPMHACVMSAFNRVDFDLEDTKRHLKGDRILVGKRGEEVACFSATTDANPRELFGDPLLPNERGTYFAAAAVASKEQGKGLYGQMNKERIYSALAEFSPFIFTRTQNPLVEAGITKELREMRGIRRFVDFTLERVLVREAYGERLTGEPLQSPASGYIKHAYERLDAEKGDAYILFFHLLYDMTPNEDGAAFYP